MEKESLVADLSIPYSKLNMKVFVDIAMIKLLHFSNT